MYVFSNLKIVAVIVLAALVSSLALGNPLEATPEPLRPAALRALTEKEVQEALKEYIGVADTWKNHRPLLQRVLGFNPFKRKKTLQEELAIITRLSRSTQPDALQVLATAIYTSPYREVRSLLTVVQGDKRLALEAARFSPDFNPRFMLSFFQYLQYGVLESQHKKNLSDFSSAFSRISYELKQSLERSERLNIPMIIEFESSALMSKSPLTLLLFNTIMRSAGNNPSQLIKAELTPSNGRILFLNPEYARTIVENVERFTQDFEKNINLAKRNFSEEDTSQRERERIVDLLRDGVGLSSVFYSEERLQEIEQLQRSNVKSCSLLFN